MQQASAELGLEDEVDDVSFIRTVSFQFLFVRTALL